MVPGIEQRHVTARDGTRIGYQVRGTGPAVVLANGLGGTYIAFRHLYELLGQRYRVVCWDYRGLYTTAAPADPHANTVAHQVEDLIDILDAEGIDRAVLCGWSMGVQVGFETWRQHRGRVAGYLAINGTSGKAFHTVLSSRLIGQVIPTLLQLVRAQADLVGRASQVVAGSDALIAALKRFGLVSGTIDTEVFRTIAAGFRTIDWRIYSDLLARLDQHDAADLLPSIAVPTTIVTGDRDIMTPPSTAERIHRAIPGSRLVVITGGTHYTPVEYPAVVCDELTRLLARVPGWGDDGAGRG
ncbi:MAG: alpha/beta hydrolase [Kofleriaceae bacterium]|jgi:3-oxoadipate enol-lactonase|nr:alpha/beta hydrolase [Kofleriaceae bacterium]MBP6837973.1 alpha/beta hydrolase [Kofleriaceae bacterium]MBP9208216.1 alpha/beta hydrolase [Kofleriaceae bacterium]